MSITVTPQRILQTDAYSSSMKSVEDFKNREAYKPEFDSIEGSSDEERRTKETELMHKVIGTDAAIIGKLVDWMSGSKAGLGDKLPTIKEAFHDFLSIKDFPNIIGPAIEVYMRAYQMPQIMISTQIMQEIPFNGQRDTVNIKAVGPVSIEEVGRAEQYPEIGNSIVDKAFKMQIDIKKYGIKIGIEDELYTSDNWGILGWLIQGIADGFILHEEDMAMNMINNMGVTIFNNKTPALGLEKKITSGRDITGNFNGTFTVHDMMTMWIYGYMRGFNYDTMLIHPFAWQMFATDPEMKEIVVAGAMATSAMNSAKIQGSGAGGFEMPFGERWGYKSSKIGGSNPSDPYYAANGSVDPIFGKLGFSPFANTLNPYWATFNIPPKSGMFPGGLKVIVTPRVLFAQDPASLKYFSNLYFVDSQKTGMIIRGEGPTSQEWEDVEREIKYIKFKKRFGMAAAFQGRGIAAARYIVIDKNYVFSNVNNASLGNLTPTSTAMGVAFP